MICTPCTYSPDTAVDYSQTSFSDTSQLSLLSGMDMPAKSSENAQQTDGFPACTCGKGTFDCSIHPSTPESWTAFMRDSLAKTLASLESRQAYLREPDQVFTEKSCGSLAWYDQSSCSWKTSQQSLVTDWEPYSETWPRWGMTVGGSAFVHPMSERRITETDGFYLPTPTVKTGAQVSWDKTPGQTGGTSLLGYVKFFPTPTTVDAGTGRFNTSVGSSNARPTLAMMAKKALWPHAVVVDMFSTTNYLAGTGAQTAKARIYPTATATMYKGWSKNHNRANTDDRLDYTIEREASQQQIGGKLNPQWVEWLMGFPIGFTVSKDWVTLRFHCKPQPRIDSLGDVK